MVGGTKTPGWSRRRWIAFKLRCANLRAGHLASLNGHDDVSTSLRKKPRRVHLDRVDDRGGHPWDSWIGGHSFV